MGLLLCWGSPWQTLSIGLINNNPKVLYFPVSSVFLYDGENAEHLTKDEHKTLVCK